MAAQGVERTVLSKILNHVDGSVTGRYDAYTYIAEKRTALERWGREVWTRAAVMGAKRALPSFVAEFPEVEQVPAYIEFAQRWLTGDPCERPEDWSPYPRWPQPEDYEAFDALEPVCSESCDGAFRAALFLRDVDGDAWSAVTPACDVLVASQDAVGASLWGSVSADLAQWALGLDDEE